MSSSSPKFEVQRIDHVVLRVTDLQRSVEFYNRILGCIVIKENPDRGLVHRKAGASVIDLVSIDGPIGRQGGCAPRNEGRNMDHLCLRIEPFVEHEVLEHLERHAVPRSSVAKIQFGAEGDGPAVYFKDPDGNIIELKGKSL
jgi:glyoxylase I family protein